MPVRNVKNAPAYFDIVLVAVDSNAEKRSYKIFQFSGIYRCLKVTVPIRETDHVSWHIRNFRFTVRYSAVIITGYFAKNLGIKVARPELRTFIFNRYDTGVLNSRLEKGQGIAAVNRQNAHIVFKQDINQLFTFRIGLRFFIVMSGRCIDVKKMPSPKFGVQSRLGKEKPVECVSNAGTEY